MSKERFGFGAARFGRQPAPRPIARPALLARLDDAPERLTVIVAGSGAGKSTLLDAWAGARGATLLELGSGRRELPEWAGRAGAPPLVIDGVHELAADSPALAWLVELSNSGGRLVVASHAPLPFEVGPAQRLGAADLAFGEDETYQVLAAFLGDAAAADALAPDLHLLTNGWPGLVGLAAAWLAQQPAGERGRRLGSLARVAEPLQEHLIAGVIDGLSRDDREFVRRLAQLPAVDAALADQLDLTEDLAALPPFVQAVPGRPGWFAVPNGWKALVRRQLPMPADEVAALLAAYQGM